MPKIDNFRIWFEYDILGWPPTVLAQKYNIGVSRICNHARKKRDTYEKYPIANAWLCEPKWNKDRDGIEWRN